MALCHRPLCGPTPETSLTGDDRKFVATACRNEHSAAVRLIGPARARGETRLTTSCMAKNIALLFAGQGAQCLGMGRSLAEQFPVAADLFRQADEILGRSLTEIAWNGPIDELTKTSNCQPALYVHALAALA